MAYRCAPLAISPHLAGDFQRQMSTAQSSLFTYPPCQRLDQAIQVSAPPPLLTTQDIEYIPLLCSWPFHFYSEPPMSLGFGFPPSIALTLFFFPFLLVLTRDLGANSTRSDAFCILFPAPLSDDSAIFLRYPFLDGPPLPCGKRRFFRPQTSTYCRLLPTSVFYVLRPLRSIPSFPLREGQGFHLCGPLLLCAFVWLSFSSPLQDQGEANKTSSGLKKFPATNFVSKEFLLTAPSSPLVAFFKSPRQWAPAEPLCPGASCSNCNLVKISCFPRADHPYWCYRNFLTPPRPS